ncbi:putative ankyrin repeat protein [Cotonvirus japonicus]|uniref:Ankyrin repeat protein n=1 Tax=Cotonvirus japonicus TaxID=2811091 RepID=A0ABM7NR12_9VIRU|nr:putative ankyrin repeat protein [Cotonvirus japonicus]BCS82595.1 putative ankyrin repeat protein [Cotonvirus japonicus]
MNTFFYNFVSKILQNNDINGLEILSSESNDLDYAQIIECVWNLKKEWIELIYHQLNYGQKILSKKIIKQAIKCGIIEIIKIVIDKKISIPDKYFVLACQINNYDIVKLLLDYGADVNYQNSQALYECCCEDYYDICQLLLDYGTDITSGRCLIAACKYGSLKIVQLLLDHGFDPYYDNGKAFNTCCKNNNGFFVSYEFNNNYYDICRLLLDHGYVINENDPEFINTMIYCIKIGNNCVLQFILNQGINLDCLNRYLNGTKFKHEGYNKIFDILIESGFEINNIGKILLDKDLIIFR